jgi:mannan endo-1,4-beta-mannosidase
MLRPHHRLLAASVFVVAVISAEVVPVSASSEQAQGILQAGSVASAAALPESLLYWGARIDGAPDDVSRIDAFEKAVGKRPSIVQWGAPWKRRGRMLPFQRTYFERIRARGSIPMFDWGSWDSCCESEQPEFRLSTIINGDWDEYIVRFAQDARAWGHPFFLRFDHEMNGWWYAWSEQANENGPGEFVQMWQHVHDIFAQQGATNVTWVWCPNIVGRYSTPMTRLYPGDDYVDWVCMDGYNWGTDYDNLWMTFTEVFTGKPSYGVFNTYEQLLGLAPTKPIMIGETASSENGGSKANWITDMLEVQLPSNFPQIKAVVWFDTTSSDPVVSWPLESSPSALSAFSIGIASPVYPDNAYATLNVSPIPPPEYLIPTQAVEPQE